jgi:polysaccharide export outer membrane protein
VSICVHLWPIILLFLLLTPIPAALAQPPQEPPPPSPHANLPVQPIGPNDLVAVAVYGAPELTRTVRVSGEGDLRLPMLAQRIPARGLLPAALESAIAQALVAESILVDPVVTVTVAEYHSRPISVAGAVKTPLTFQAVGPVTLLEALARAGGLDPAAGSEILVTRKGGLIQRIPVRRLMDGSDTADNLTLAGGEEVRIPEAGRIFVVGNVKRPGSYTVRDGNEATLLQALAYAEGLMPHANKNAFIYRRRPDQATASASREIPVELRKVLDRKSPDVPLEPNDILYIPDSKGSRLGMAALDRVLMFGSTAGATALIYNGRIR